MNEKSSDNPNNPVIGYFKQELRKDFGNDAAKKSYLKDKPAVGRLKAEKVAAQEDLIGVLAKKEYEQRIGLSDRMNEKQDEINAADRDVLITDAFNRKRFLESVTNSLNLSQRTGEPVSIIFEDLDRFKAINDTYDHAFGDLLLRLAGRANKNAIRSTDAFGRYGGEELTVLLNDSDPLQAILTAERIQHNYQDILNSASDRKGVEDIVPEGFEYPEGFNPYQTLSFGIVTHQPNQSPEEFIQAGDAAMYKAKDIRHQEQELDIDPQSSVGKIAINTGEKIYVINTHAKLIAEKLKTLDLTDQKSFSDWLSISLGEPTTGSQNFDQYIRRIKTREEDITQAVHFMLNRNASMDLIKSQLASLLKLGQYYHSN